VHGLQVGVFNYAHSSEDGVPIGLISIVVKGLHELEISSNERGYANIALRTGTKKFYNILNFGFDPSMPDRALWSFGYGIGHRFDIQPEFNLALDLTAHHLNDGKFSAYTNEWMQLAFTAEFRPARGFALSAGPVLNYFITGAHNELLTRFQQAPIYSNTHADGIRDMMWVGAVFSLRFF
jgi:hypothetical protein